MGGVAESAGLRPADFDLTPSVLSRPKRDCVNLSCRGALFETAL